MIEFEGCYFTSEKELQDYFRELIWEEYRDNDDDEWGEE